ncbi:hypothetical protein A3K63_00035 [Candidatus Micrarchaeota archaeon RBG_16_49_10]|nr:MAG: hypothetical protein A3K63_00035 [Candidatus Micrarchaeota archaeon RBG_16_49_10]
MTIPGVFKLPDTYTGDVSRLPSGIWVVQIYFDEHGFMSSIYAGEKDSSNLANNMERQGLLFMTMSNEKLIRQLGDYLSKNRPIGFASVYSGNGPYFLRMTQTLEDLGFPINPIVNYNDFI